MIKAIFFFIGLFIATSASAQDHPKTILWEVTHHGNNHKSYLFGTFHEVSPAFLERLPNTISKLNQSNILFVERKQSTSDTLGQNAISWDLNKWKALLTNRQDSIFDAFTNKADDKYYYKMPPLLLSVQVARLYLQNFCDTERMSNELMDPVIENMASKQNKKVFSLDERHDVVITDIQNSLNETEDSFYVSACIEMMENMLNADHSGCAILTEYKNFNLNYALDVDLIKAANDAPLLLERNKKWMPILDKAFLQHDCFVAVGFKHLFYKQGLIQQLRSLGYKVSPIPAE